MGEKKLVDKKPREFMTMAELREEMVDWSVDTIRRRIKNEGFPAIKDTNGFLFSREAVRLWFKKRQVQG